MKVTTWIAALFLALVGVSCGADDDDEGPGQSCGRAGDNNELAADGSCVCRAGFSPCTALSTVCCAPTGPVCGDGRCEAGEGCSADCGVPPVCGNGMCEAGESCDGDCGTPGAVCGNGVCEAGETCAADCGAPSCTQASCTGETFCQNGTSCVDAFPRRYRFTVTEGVFAERRPDGSSWDPLGGAPDPFVRFTLNGVGQGTTSTVDDRYNWVLNEFWDVNLIAGSTIRLDLVDADLNFDDAVVACENTITGEVVRFGMDSPFTCDGLADFGASFSFTVEPL